MAAFWNRRIFLKKVVDDCSEKVPWFKMMRYYYGLAKNEIPCSIHGKLPFKKQNCWRDYGLEPQ